MGYEEHSVQGGTTRTILPIVTAERSNSIVSVHVKRYTGYVSTYIVDSNGVTVSTSMGYAMDGQYDVNCVMDKIDRSKESKIRLKPIVIPLPILMGNGTASDTL